MSSISEPTNSAVHFASLKRRLICMAYEAILLFGIFFAAGFLFDVITQNLSAFSALTLRHWRQLFLFIVIGLYFTYFWRHGGQTLPLQTWRIKVVSTGLQTISWKQAWLRYCIAWMWFLPALSLNYLFEITQWPGIFVLIAGIAGWALTSKLDKNGQFLHDKLAGTQLILIPSNSRIDCT